MYTLAQLANRLDGCLHGDAKQLISGIASLSRAAQKDLSYYDNPNVLPSLITTKAGAVLLTEANLKYCPVSAVIVANPLLSMTIAAEFLTCATPCQKGVHPSAQISVTSELGEGVSVGANSVISEAVSLDNGVQIAANCIIEAGVTIGEGTVIHNGVYIHSGSVLGKHLQIDSGVVIGASPFNSSKKEGHWRSGPAVGGVLISNGVYLGANTVISRGALGDTSLGQGVYIDSLVQIAHDVSIGANTAVAGCAAIGAYAQIGSDCIIGGASYVAAEVRLADDIVITGMSTVNKSLSKAGVYSSGIMISDHQRWRRNAARFRRLDDYIVRLNRLENEYSKIHK